jgi:hypothetical protein
MFPENKKIKLLFYNFECRALNLGLINFKRVLNILIIVNVFIELRRQNEQLVLLSRILLQKLKRCI